MHADEVGGRRGKECFVRFPKLTYATIQDGLLKRMAARKIGRNGWAVMVAFCKTIYTDGCLGKLSSAAIQEVTGLTDKQVARGMADLRDKGIIEPIIRTTRQGYRNPDKSNLNHVAQYRFTKGSWNAIERDGNELKQNDASD